MGKKSSRQDIARNRILDAAIILFADKGYSDTAIEDISKKADVAVGTVYSHFLVPVKADIMLSIALRFWADLNESIRDRIENDVEKGSAINKLHVILGALKKRLYESREALNLAKTLHETIPKNFPTEHEKQLRKKHNEIKVEIGNFLETMDNIIREAQEMGEFKKDLDPVALRQILYGAFEMLVYELFLRKKYKRKIEGYSEKTIDEALNFLIRSFSNRTRNESHL